MPDAPWVRALPVGHDFATYTAMHSAREDHPYFLKLRENDTKAACADLPTWRDNNPECQFVLYGDSWGSWSLLPKTMYTQQISLLYLM